MIKKAILSFLFLCLYITCTQANNTIINRWAFQDYSDFVFDNTDDLLSAKKGGSFFNPELVNPGNVIFVRRNSLHEFFMSVHPKIKVCYILLTHVDDMAVPGRYERFLNDANIITWFGIHPNISNHPKFVPIPIGIYPDKEFCSDLNADTFFRHLRDQTRKSKLLYMNFSLWTNRAERPAVRAQFLHKSFCFTQDGKLPFKDYLAQMAQCKFVLSPAGNGIDCYRTWEALMVGCIPIVKSSYLNNLYKDLPVLIIDDWQQVTEKFLKAKYVELSLKKYNFSKLYSRYWLNKIDSARKGVKVSK